MAVFNATLQYEEQSCSSSMIEHKHKPYVMALIAMLSLVIVTVVHAANASGLKNGYIRVTRPKVPVNIPDAFLTFDVGKQLPLFQENPEFFIALFDSQSEGKILCAFRVKKGRGKIAWITPEKDMFFGYRAQSCDGKFYLQRNEKLPVLQRDESGYEVIVKRYGREATLWLPKHNSGYKFIPPPTAKSKAVPTKRSPAARSKKTAIAAPRLAKIPVEAHEKKRIRKKKSDSKPRVSIPKSVAIEPIVADTPPESMPEPEAKPLAQDSSPVDEPTALTEDKPAAEDIAEPVVEPTPEPASEPEPTVDPIAVAEEPSSPEPESTLPTVEDPASDIAEAPVLVAATPEPEPEALATPEPETEAAPEEAAADETSAPQPEEEPDTPTAATLPPPQQVTDTPQLEPQTAPDDVKSEPVAEQPIPAPEENAEPPTDSEAPEPVPTEPE